ncbi:hypothetical protein HPB50_029611 [Hyalomma asiaticum]|nr:hypothetical protein HPB50_029611 [Hyalomma asiaticum]
MASTTEAMDSSAGSAEDLQTTPGTSATSNDQEDAAFEDADFAAGKMGWKVVTSRKTKKKERAATTAQLSQQENHPSGGQVSFTRTPPNIMNRVIRASRMPHLPEDNIKIVFRPKGGLNIQKVGPILVSKALVKAANLRQDQTTEDIICPNIMQNIMVASTPFRENADKYADVTAIRIAGKEYEVSPYEAAPSDTCKRVIRHIDTADDHRTIERNIVNDRNPSALAAKRIKNSGSVIVVFDGLRVPNFVRYGPTLVPCYLYRRQVDICYVCGKLGHRADVRPDPGSTECRGCGISNPTSSHVCDPQCKLCGGTHVTADKMCSKRYLIPYVVRARRQRARLEQQELAQLEEDKQQTERGRSTSKTSTRSRSRSRSRSHTPARTSTTGGSRSGSQVRFAGRNNGVEGTWAAKVRGATMTTPKEKSESCNTDKERIAMLEHELRELKAAYTKLILELSEARKVNSGTTTRTPEPPTDIETPLPVEIARQGEHREDSPAPKKRAVTQPRMAVRSDVKDAMEVMSENMRLMNESMMRMNEKMDMFNTRVQKMEMYLNNTVVPAIERMTSPHLGAHGPLHDAFTASEGGSDGQHGSDK